MYSVISNSFSNWLWNTSAKQLLVCLYVLTCPKWHQSKSQTRRHTKCLRHLALHYHSSALELQDVNIFWPYFREGGGIGRGGEPRGGRGAVSNSRGGSCETKMYRHQPERDKRRPFRLEQRSRQYFTYVWPDKRILHRLYRYRITNW